MKKPKWAFSFYNVGTEYGEFKMQKKMMITALSSVHIFFFLQNFLQNQNSMNSENSLDSVVFFLQTLQKT